MANRHLLRSIVLQTLFEWDFLMTQKKGTHSQDQIEEEVEKVLQRNLKEFAPSVEKDDFVISLLKEVIKKHGDVDKIIEASAPDWPIDKISVVDRNILRIGLTELLFGDRGQVPPKVAINEAIELAKTFGGENSSKFINGVLGAVYKEMGEPDKDQVSKKKDNKVTTDKSKLPTETLGGALVYAKADDKVMLALVHDVFGYWTLSKGTLKEGENAEEGTKREIKEEIGLDIKVEEELGSNEYVASHPEKGKTLKKVRYFLASSEYRELKLEKSGGLDEARWFDLKEIPGLHIYSDIVPLIAKALKLLLNTSTRH